MLWLVLSLPRLPLEVFPCLPPPAAIIHRERIVVIDDVAASAGVLPGLRLAEAWGFLPGLSVRERDLAREQAALIRLACWAGNFTSEVSLLPPRTLLLEVAGSLRLFGGAAALFERVVAGCSEQGFAPQAALAPTPLAGQWLASAGDDRACLDTAELPHRLGKLPLAVLELPARKHARLVGFGVRSIADMLRLPRAGLARRLGADLADDLARALGDLPDPRPRFVFPERFAERLELPMPVDSAMALFFAMRRLVATLCGWLAVRAAGIRECVFELAHECGRGPRSATMLVLAFSSVTRSAERIARVLDERLQRLELPTTVLAITLQVEAPAALPGHAKSLFGARGKSAGDSLAVLIEGLQARLGKDSVHALSAVAEHRPENASRRVAPTVMPFAGNPDSAGPERFPSRRTVARMRERKTFGQDSGQNVRVVGAVFPLQLPAGRESPPPSAPDVAKAAPGPRPLWLLAKPQALDEAAGRPQYGGPLRLLCGPERIESGWWDAAEPDAVGDVRRDYFVAISTSEEWLWIFRSSAGWFLHGLFA